MKTANPDPSELAKTILASKKYRSLNLPPETVIDLIQNALNRGYKPEKAVDDAREKLHNIIAPYLGDPDYNQAMNELRRVGFFDTGAAMQAFSLKMLESHASTKERIPELEEFYSTIRSVIGKPSIILDLACAMQPFAHPWMGLPADCRYFAYDLHQPRVDLINQYFNAARINGQAFYGDILLQPPSQQADAAFFFKEAHRFDQRQKGCNRAFWQALNVRWLVVSLPATNLTGRFDLADRQRKLVNETLTGLDWPVTEFLVGNELIFCVRKEHGEAKA
jgi:16S rRNA (guanine(1405)-N(7))-methyltransferase